MLMARGKWVDKKGRVYNLSDISTSYLQNIVRFLRRQYERKNLSESWDKKTLLEKIKEVEEELLKRGAF